ncbi:MAG TPA: ATP-binding cassette domain-containing protein, partial [Kribbellaceae bacterium]
MTAVSELAVSTRGLRKTYRSIRGRRTVAVRGLDLDVPAGGVHGFLGPNGSGKTTSIRMLLGLIRADAGSMEIFGQPVPERLPDVVSRVG